MKVVFGMQSDPHGCVISQRPHVSFHLCLSLSLSPPNPISALDYVSILID